MMAGRKTCSKLQTYSLHGIISSINLIMTFETQENPLSAEDVMEVIEKYFGVESKEELIKVQFQEIE